MRLVCQNCDFDEGPFKEFELVRLVNNIGDMADVNVSDERIIMCPKCGIAGTLEDFNVEKGKQA